MGSERSRADSRVVTNDHAGVVEGVRAVSGDTLIRGTRTLIIAGVEPLPPTKFDKSRSNSVTEKLGLSVLLSDARFQRVDLLTKRRVLILIAEAGLGSGLFGHQTFDVIMTPIPRPPITTDNVDRYFDEATLVEMKTTRKPIRNAALNGFFFGATERERAMARALGDRYRFAFVVLNEVNDFGRPFAVLLPLEEVERRTREWRVQYQVSFRSDIVVEPGNVGDVIVFGSEGDLPPS
jgi:hypothetical protein